MQEEGDFMRVVAGTLRSRKIEAVEGLETRPTSDKIKEAIFSRIGPYFQGGLMLDGYSGSGNMAIEAISRGIEKTIVCEVNSLAVKTIKKNCQTLKISEQVEIKQRDVERYLSETELVFDLIYLDPPYLEQKNEELMKIINQRSLLNQDGHLVIESRKQDEFADQVGQLIKVKEAVYGITKITYYLKEEK